MKKIFPVILFFFCHIPQAQNNYLMTDSSYISRFTFEKTAQKDYYQYVKVINGNSVIKYTANEVVEFGLPNGDVYVSKEISLNGLIKSVFLKRILKGAVSLYDFKGFQSEMHYLEKDGILYEVSEESTNYTSTLKFLLSDCQFINKHLENVKKSTSWLMKIVSFYNNCDDNPSPFSRFGVTGGLNAVTLKPDINSSQVNKVIAYETFNSASSGMFGIFLDIPLGLSHFQFHPEINFSKYSSVTETEDANLDKKIEIDLTSFSIPLLIKYTIGNNKVSPFFSLGGEYTLHLKNEGRIHSVQYFKDDPDIISDFEQELLSNSMFGYKLGIGSNIQLSYKQIMSFQMRYGKSIGSGNSLVKDQISFLASITF